MNSPSSRLATTLGRSIIAWNTTATAGLLRSAMTSIHGSSSAAGAM